MENGEPKKIKSNVEGNNAKERNQLLVGSYVTSAGLLLVYLDIVPLLVPAFVVAVVSGFVAWIFIKPTLRPLVPAIALLSGDIVLPLIVLVGIVDPSIVIIFLFQVVLISGGLVWLVFRPGIAPVAFLALIQILLIMDNILTVVFSRAMAGGPTEFYSKLDMHVPSDMLMYKGLAVSVFLRAIAIILMFVGLRAIKNKIAPNLRENQQ